tara:strand:- start:276 stop:542 length:267 start_codon:yes stop_codon:yes gene_type:complete
MAETLSKDSKVVIFDSAVELEDANVNNVKQGITVGNLNGFVKIGDKPTAQNAAAKQGELVFVPSEGGEGTLYIAKADNSWAKVALAAY